MSDRDNAIVRMPYWIMHAEDLAILNDEGITDYYSERMLSFVVLELQAQLVEVTAERDRLLAEKAR